MQNLWIDFETYYDNDYSLKKMTPAEYIADVRFEALGCAFVWDGGEEHIEGPELPEYLADIDWDNTCAIAHNSLFDMLILSMRYGIYPTRYGDTLAMARNWISHSTGGSSLKECCQFYGLPAKWDTVARTKGKTFAMICQDPALRREVRDYALDDTRKCKAIYELMLASGFPVGELDIIDMVVRMAALPQFEVDLTLAAEHLAEVKAKKQELLDRANLDSRDNLMRDEALAAMLIFAEPELVLPKKISKTTGIEQFAFAKTDKAFTELLEHENPDVQALVAARLGHKSTLEETRTTRFIAIGQATPQFPIPLKYSGAHTHRLSGDWSINAQNLPRGGKLRRALKAPKGKVVVSIDASQIEARINACLSGETELVIAFREGRDVYCEFASIIYQQEVSKRDELERFVGKTSILSLGYSSSALVFQNMLRVQGGVIFNLIDAARVVELYRMTYRKIVKNWYRVTNEVLPVLASYPGEYGKLVYGPCEVERNVIVLPNGNRLNYRDMHTEEYVNLYGRATTGYVFMRGHRRIYTYGAKVVENIVQALAFLHIMEVAKRVAKMTGGLLPLAHQVHDELIYIVDEHLAVQVGRLVQQEMAKSPAWMPDLPLAAEFKIGPNYGDVMKVS